MNTTTISFIAPADRVQQTPVEQWLGELGLVATEVDRCPVAGCPHCRTPLPHAA